MSQRYARIANLALRSPTELRRERATEEKLLTLMWTSGRSLWGESCQLSGDKRRLTEPHPAWPVSPSMILLTLQIRRVMMRLMASQGLLGPLATVEATMGAKDSTMTAPSNTCGRNTQTGSASRTCSLAGRPCGTDAQVTSPQCDGQGLT